MAGRGERGRRTSQIADKIIKSQLPYNNIDTFKFNTDPKHQITAIFVGVRSLKEPEGVISLVLTAPVNSDNNQTKGVG